MDSQVEEVKSRIDIVSLVSGYVALKKAGRNYKGLCPFHSEKSGSFMVSPERGIYKCFGCGEGGDSLSFYQKIEGVEFPEALKALAVRAGVTLKEFKPSPESALRETMAKINSLSSEFYHFLLTKHSSGKKPLEYLKARGVSDKSVREWQLGFAPDGWDHTFKFLRDKKKFEVRDIIASGICLPSSQKGPYDRFRSRIMFPIRNIAGSVVGFSGRIFGEGEPKYLNSPDNLLFNKSNNLYGLDLAKMEIKKQNESVLVEGNLDVISSHQIGQTNVVAPLGTALTERQVELMRRFGENLVISFDQDSAGISAAKRGIELAEKLGLAVKLALISEKDPDELIKKSPAEWKKAIKESVSVYDYVIETTLARYGKDGNYAIKKITAEVVPILSKIENEITRSHYERLLASKLGVSEAAVKAEINKQAAPRVSESSTEKVAVTTEQNKLEKYLLTLIVQEQQLPKDLELVWFRNKRIHSLLELIIQNSAEHRFKIKELTSKIPLDLQDLLEEVILAELSSELSDFPDKMEHEVASCLLRLKELNLRTKLRSLNLAIKQAEVAKNSEEISGLTKSFSDLSAQLGILEKKLEN